MAPARPPISKDLLQLEQRDTSLASGVKPLSICKPKVQCSPSLSKTLPLDMIIGESNVLGRVQAFLPVLSKANCKLAEAIKEKGPDAFDIEVLHGHETVTHIEMDLALGVAELYSDDAVSAAEKLVNGRVIQTEACAIEQDSDSESHSSDCDVDKSGDKLRIRKKRRPRIEVLS